MSLFISSPTLSDLEQKCNIEQLSFHGPLLGHGNILRWATELFKKLLDLLKNSVSFVILWLSLHFCVCLIVLTVVTMNDTAVFLLQRDNFRSNYSINIV